MQKWNYRALVSLLAVGSPTTRIVDWCVQRQYERTNISNRWWVKEKNPTGSLVGSFATDELCVKYIGFSIGWVLRKWWVMRGWVLFSRQTRKKNVKTNQSLSHYEEFNNRRDCFAKCTYDVITKPAIDSSKALSSLHYTFDTKHVNCMILKEDMGCNPLSNLV